MWFLETKDSELVFYGCVFRWTIPVCVSILTLALAYSWIK